MKRVEVGVLAVISTWESVALLSGRVPTVTSVVRRLPYPVRVGLVSFAAGWLFGHFELVDYRKIFRRAGLRRSS